MSETANDRKFDIIFDISMISQKQEESPKEIGLYLNYISAVIDLYTVLCANRNVEGSRSVRDRIGASHKTMLYCCMSPIMYEVPISTTVKSHFLNLAKVLVLDSQPFIPYSNDHKIRVFFWEELKDSDPSNTVYEWNKSKYGDDLSNGHGTNAEEVKFTALKMRRIITDFVDTGPTDMLEFLYSSEKKVYLDWMINPKM